MSRVPYTVNVDEYICSALEQIRKMNVTHDYSSLLAVVERIQNHANAMEDAIYSSFDMKSRVKQACLDDNLSDEDFRKKVKEIMEKSRD